MAPVLHLSRSRSHVPDTSVSTYNTRYQNPETPVINTHRVNLKTHYVARFKQTPITYHTSYSKQVFAFGIPALSSTPWSIICTHRWTVLHKPDCRGLVTYTDRDEAAGRWIRRDSRGPGNHCCSWLQTSRQSSVKKISVTPWRDKISSFPRLYRNI